MIDLLYVLVFVGGTVAVTLGAYFLMRLFTGGDPEGRDKDLASSVIVRVSALHVLILALVFAQELIDYQQLRLESAIEANALADVYHDAGRYGDVGSPIQAAVKEYTRLVIHDEWKTLGSTGRLSQAAWDQWNVAYLGVLDLAASNDRQKSLRDHMLKQIHVISETRMKREDHGTNTIAGVFWFAAVAGVFFIALAYYYYPPDRRNLLLISMFGAYTGIILFLIYGFSNPYRPPAAFTPDAYQRLYDGFPKG